MRSLFRHVGQVGALLLLTGANAAVAQLNGGFETPLLPAGAYSYAPAGASWTFSGGAGLSRTNSGFTTGAPEVPQRQQVGFIQNTGSMEQPLAISTGAVLSFYATQRPGFWATQQLQVYVNGVLQSFKLGNPAGRQTVSSITPPHGYYELYSLRLDTVRASGTYTVKIKGTNTVGDATALIDGVGLSIPSSRRYGFWDQGLLSAAWRSDLPTNTTAFSTGPCLDVDGPDPVVGAGATPFGWTTGQPSTPCYGQPGGPYLYPAATQSNWYSSGYSAGLPHWITAINNEFVAFSNCSSGPPNQSIANVVPGSAAGASLLVTALTTVSDPVIGNHNVVNLLYNEDPAENDDCIPYLAFGASSTHGNETPVAIVTLNDNQHRPDLSFKQTVMETDGSSYAVAWLTLWVSGWTDNVRRAVQIALGHQAFINGYALYRPTATWNWNVVESYYYPGAVIHHTSVEKLNQFCPSLNLPAVSFTNTYVGSGESPSSISSYGIDLHDLMNCLAQNGAWGGATNQLPDPLAISGVEWALEQVEYTNPHNHLSFWDMRIQ